MRSCWRMTVLPMFAPVLEEVVSKQEAMMPSEIFQLSSASFTVAASTLPVASSVFAMHSSWFSSSCTATTASRVTQNQNHVKIFKLRHPPTTPQPAAPLAILPTSYSRAHPHGCLPNSVWKDLCTSCYTLLHPQVILEVPRSL